MNVNALGASDPTGGTGSTPAADAKDMFLQLLMAQLKSQSPLDPVILRNSWDNWCSSTHWIN